MGTRKIVFLTSSYARARVHTRSFRFFGRFAAATSLIYVYFKIYPFNEFTNTPPLPSYCFVGSSVVLAAAAETLIYLCAANLQLVPASVYNTFFIIYELSWPLKHFHTGIYIFCTEFIFE